MKLKVFILFCLLKTIAGGVGPKIPIGFPPLSSRIVGGTDAVNGSAPHQVSLQKNGAHFCGGSIISENWVVSAAHCLALGISGTTILAGTNDLKNGGVRYTPEKFILHEQYDKPPFANDIGLIRVKEVIEFNKLVQPINVSAKVVPGGAELVTTGWGRLTAGGAIPQLLQVLNVSSISNEDCKAVHGDVVDPSHLCTYTKAGEGVCSGDSGGPLVLNGELVGVTNWAVLCALGYPDGFARVSYLYDWVQGHVNATHF